MSKKRRYSEQSLSEQELLTARWRAARVEQTEVFKVGCETLLPVDTENRSPLSFTIPPMSGLVVDGNNIKLGLTFHLEKYEENAWTTITNEKVAVINNALYSLFSDQHLFLNSQLVESYGMEFARISYLKNLLYTSDAQKFTTMESVMWMPDTKSLHDQFTDATASPSAAKRWLMTSNSAKVNLFGALMSDMLASDAPIGEDVSINIKLYPASSAQCLVKDRMVPDPTQYRAVIDDAYLLVARYKLYEKPPPTVTHRYTNYKMMSFPIINGQSKIGPISLTAAGNVLPSKCIAFLTDEARQNGNYTNRLNMQHYNVEQMLLSVNGKQKPSYNGYVCDFGEGKAQLAYESLFSQLNAKAMISYDEYKGGYTMFGWDCTPNRTGDMYSETATKGETQISAQFKEPLATNVYLNVLLVYTGRFQINGKGVVTVDMNQSIA
jgi:hypothetical protein